MSPARQWADVSALGFPRVSGDEPGQMIEEPKPGLFSPRERG